MFSRRLVLGATSLGLSGLVTPATAQGTGKPLPADVGAVKDGAVTFPPWQAETERPDAPTPAPLPPSERVGFAIVGLGKLALDQIMPAFAQCKYAKPVALVSGRRDKAEAVARQYGIETADIYDYGDFDRIAGNGKIGCVYIVLPNAQHREFVARTAAAKKHVLCEKPMAMNPGECREMIAACAAAAVKLMIAYRCQYEPVNRAALALVRSGRFGPVKLIDAINLQNMGTPQQWRYDKALAGGGALFDIGIYCLNAARFMTGEEPVEVQAHFVEEDAKAKAAVEQGAFFTLRFPGGAVANCSASYGAHQRRHLGLYMPSGWIEMPNAFAYDGQELHVSHRMDKAESTERLQVGAKNQFALEIDHMARCILDDRRPHTAGEEGLADHVVMAAIEQAAASGTRVALAPQSGRDASRGPPPSDG